MNGKPSEEREEREASEEKTDDLLRRVEEARDLKALEALRISLLGRRGDFHKRLRALGSLPKERRAQEGRILNNLQTRLQEAIKERKAILTKSQRQSAFAQNAVDITLPVPDAAFAHGRIHPVSRAEEELLEIFAALSFDLKEGPEIETDEHNFTALNTPPDHPARDAMDTFYFPKKDDAAPYLLRCHTSPVQVRVMRGETPPFRFIAPGRVYRRDSDQTHTPMFHQIEGLVIDKEIHLGHLKWTLVQFLRAFFEDSSVSMRFRPHYFPFTEPSLEADISLEADGGAWLEILGCGMVHPAVLRSSGLDPEEWQGFAFGTGIDRLAMLKYGIPDLRQCFDARMDWLRFYGFSALFTPTLSGGLSEGRVAP